MKRFYDRITFLIEKLLLKGALYQLLIIASLISVISFLAGLLVFHLTDGFDVFGASAWWAFLRLTDPGYLGDDEGLVLKVVSTVVTILGYVLFMGALIAIMTQWLHGTMRRLERGLTPISMKDHILILGWTNRTASIVRELAVSQGRVRRFLKRIGARKLRIVILAEDVSTSIFTELKEALGPYWNASLITFRSGSPLRADHLERVDYLRAGVIMYPGSDFFEEDSEASDMGVIKSLLTVANDENFHRLSRHPLVVAEFIDPRKIPIARTAYRKHLEAIAGDVVISRLIAQNVRHRGLSYVYAELLTHSHGNEIYLREFPRFVGTPVAELTDRFRNAIVLGLLRNGEDGFSPLLNPPEGTIVQPGDRIVFVAREYRAIEPVERSSVSPPALRQGRSRPDAGRKVKKRLLILGWNHKVPALIREFGSYTHETFAIDLLSLVPIAERETQMVRNDSLPRGTNVRHIEGDYTSSSDLMRLNPGGYDNIVFLANGWLSSHEEADARTILGYLVLQDLLSHDGRSPEILLELMDPDNERLFHRKPGEVLISTNMLSHIIAHVSLRRELNSVFDELFTVGGAEIYFESSRSYSITGISRTFRDVRDIVYLHGETLIGIRYVSSPGKYNGGIYLNPPLDLEVDLSGSVELIVLTTYAATV